MAGAARERNFRPVHARRRGPVRLSKVQSVDERMRLEYGGVGFRQLPTCPPHTSGAAMAAAADQISPHRSGTATLSARLPVRRRLIPRTSGKLTFVWSPDAVNDAGRSDDCAVSCRATPPWCLSPGLPVRREAYSTDLRQTGLRLELGCSERRGRDGWLRRFCRTTPPWPD
jgi:hypothetical protein